MNGWMDGLNDGWIYGLMNGWMDGMMVGSMDRYVDGLIGYVVTPLFRAMSLHRLMFLHLCFCSLNLADVQQSLYMLRCVFMNFCPTVFVFLNICVFSLFIFVPLFLSSVSPSVFLQFISLSLDMNCAFLPSFLRLFLLLLYFSLSSCLSLYHCLRLSVLSVSSVYLSVSLLLSMSARVCLFITRSVYVSAIISLYVTLLLCHPLLS